MTKKNYGTRITVEASPEACKPMKYNINDAAYDLYTECEVKVFGNSRMYIPLGFKIALPNNIAMIIQPRSGQSGKGMIAKASVPKWLHFLLDKKPITLRINADALVGLIDPKYGDKVQAIVKVGKLRLKHRIMKLLGFKIYIDKGSRICQGRFVYVPNVELIDGKVTGTRGGLGHSDK